MSARAQMGVDVALSPGEAGRGGRGSARSVPPNEGTRKGLEPSGRPARPFASRRGRFAAFLAGAAYHHQPLPTGPESPAPAGEAGRTVGLWVPTAPGPRARTWPLCPVPTCPRMQALPPPWPRSLSLGEQPCLGCVGGCTGDQGPGPLPGYRRTFTGGGGPPSWGSWLPEIQREAGVWKAMGPASVGGLPFILSGFA